jgi:hypothetical protein
MSLGQALRAFLISDTTPATSAVKAKIGTRVYRMRSPEGATLARVVYQRISRAPHQVLDGPSLMTRERYQLNCWGAGASPGQDAEDLAALVSAALADYRGEWSYQEGTDTVNYKVHASRADDARDLESEPGDEGQKADQAVSLDFLIDHQLLS